MSKYRAIFLEEASEHLEEMSRGLLELERDPSRAEALDLVFRMAHSIKGMAASLGYDAITEVAHRLEDRMQAARAAGRAGQEDLALLFKGLEGLEAMVSAVRESGALPPTAPALVAAQARGAPAAPFAAPPAATAGPPEKKAPSPR
jgi:two-component system chemotaxis sensor kinase CheA